MKKILIGLKTKMAKIMPMAGAGLVALSGASFATESTTVLGGVVTSSMLEGVFDEIVALLPVCIPVMVGFLAIRKGLSFVRGIIKSA